MDLKEHYTIAIYPFVPGLVSGERRSRLSALAGRWQPWWQRLAGNDLIHALDDTYFFLPYIRKLLFPETEDLPAGDANQQQTAARYLTTVPADKLDADLAVDSVLRLNYEQVHLNRLRALRLAHVSPDLNVDIDWIDVLIFPQSVGFLALKLRLCGGTATSDQLLIVLAALRTILPPTIDTPITQWHTRVPNDSITFTSRDLVDYLLQGFTATHPRVNYPTMNAYLTALQQQGTIERYTATEAGQVYGQTFWLYSYACLDSASASATSAVEPPFEYPHQHILYELANCKAINNETTRPHQLGLREQLDRYYIALWSNWQAIALPDRVFFLGTQSNDFTRQALPHNVESDYLPLYLFVLYQKMRLSLLAGEIMRHGANLHRNLSEARALWDAFIAFRNHYWLAEITVRTQGIELYRRFQQSLGVTDLYATISDGVRELQLYYEERAQRGTNDRLGFLTVAGALLAVPALLTQIYSVDLLQATSWEDLLVHCLIGYLALVLLYGCWRLWGRIRSRI